MSPPSRVRLSLFLALSLITGLAGAAPPRVDPDLKTYQAALDQAQGAMKAVGKEFVELQMAATADPENTWALQPQFAELMRQASQAGERAAANLAAIEPPARLGVFHRTLIEGHRRMGWAFAKAAKRMDAEGPQSKGTIEAMEELGRLSTALSARMARELNRAGYDMDAQGRLSLRPTAPARTPPATPIPTPIRGKRLTLQAYNGGMKKAAEPLDAITSETVKFQESVRETAGNPERVKMMTTRFIQGVKRRYDGFLARLRALRPPADLDRFHRIFVRGMTEMGTVFTELSAAIVSEDYAGAQGAQAKLREIQTRIMPQIQKAASDAGYELDPTGGLRKKDRGDRE